MEWVFSREKLNAKLCDAGRKSPSSTNKIECCLHLLSERLKGFESLTWSEIIFNDRLKSHFIPLEDLKSRNSDLYEKFESLAIEGANDEPFSLRLGWNFSHLVNFKTINGVRAVNALAGYKEMPIYSPSMLIGGYEENE
jgi:hypothetical protein